MTAAPIMIMAGGTGGHVFPALAIARALRERNIAVVWLGTRSGIEARVVPADGFKLECIRVSGLRRKGALSWLLAPVKLMVAIIDAIAVVARCKPAAVLGMGGFASGPGGMAAWLLRKPLLIHEQNAVAGLTNRLLAGFAREVFEAFPGSFSSARHARAIGNPVRADIFTIDEPAVRMADRKGPLRVLVLGGSQGAMVLNQTVPRAIAALPENVAVELWHQCGASTEQIAIDEYANAGIDARITPFIEDMKAAYSWADLVICRSGALTIAELSAAGVASVLVPYPSAVDDHQTRNANYLADAGAAVLMSQPEFSPAALADEITRCVNDRGLLMKRGQLARELACPRATEDLVQACMAQAGFA
jgi:UDP-N-acetylglucosamine--N-acetylmuramyl-(pentapeptide) pyrophosphoryl-undecaprenol N-acetylglucosamine transferase